MDSLDVLVKANIAGILLRNSVVRGWYYVERFLDGMEECMREHEIIDDVKMPARASLPYFSFHKEPFGDHGNFLGYIVMESALHEIRGQTKILLESHREEAVDFYKATAHMVHRLLKERSAREMARIELPERIPRFEEYTQFRVPIILN